MMTPKRALSTLIPLALLYAWPLSAQQPADRATDGRQTVVTGDEPEEIIVRGQRLSDFRVALETARVRVYDVFNELNGDDAFDVYCHQEESTGTRMRQTVCRPRFKDDISSAAAKAWVHGIKDGCGGNFSVVCIFGEQAASGISRAQAEETNEPLMEKRFAQEMARVVAASPELQQALLEYEALEGAYEEARGGKRGQACAGPDRPRRCSR